MTLTAKLSLQETALREARRVAVALRSEMQTVGIPILPSPSKGEGTRSFVSVQWHTEHSSIREEGTLEIAFPH